MKELKKELSVLVSSLQENSNDDQIIKSENLLKKNQMDITKLKTEQASIISNINTEKKKHKSIEKSVADNKNMIEVKAKKREEMNSSVEKIRAETEQAEVNLKKAQQEYEALCCGFVVDEESNQVQTIQDQFLNVKNKLSEHQTLIKKAQIKYAYFVFYKQLFSYLTAKPCI